MTYLINPEARGVDNPSHVWDWGFCHVTDHVFLARPLSTLLRAICRPLPPGCEFWCGRVVLLTRRAISCSSSAVSPLSTSCEGWVGACTTRFLTQVNHLSAVLLTTRLLPCLLKAASTGSLPNPCLVVVASDVHHHSNLSKEM